MLIAKRNGKRVAEIGVLNTKEAHSKAQMWV